MPSPKTTRPSVSTVSTRSLPPASSPRSAWCRSPATATPRGRTRPARGSSGRGSGEGAAPLEPDRPAPAGRAGPGADEHARTTPAARPARRVREAVARGLVARVADVDLVEREQRLPVVGAGLDHGARLDRGPSPRQQRRRSPAGGCRTSTPGLRPGSGSMPITGWPSRYFATLATSPSWPTTTTTSSGANRNRARSPRSTLPRRQSSGIAAATARARPALAVVRGLELGEVAAAGGEEERRLPARAVPGHQLVELGAAVHHDHPRGQASRLHPSPLPSWRQRPGQQVGASAPGSRSAAGCRPAP